MQGLKEPQVYGPRASLLLEGKERRKERGKPGLKGVKNAKIAAEGPLKGPSFVTGGAGEKIRG